MTDAGEKVVARIVPNGGEQVSSLAQHQEIWGEIVVVKARIAECMNELRAAMREVEELRSYITRSVRRLDATTSRLQRGQPQQRPRG